MENATAAQENSRRIIEDSAYWENLRSELQSAVAQRNTLPPEKRQGFCFELQLTMLKSLQGLMDRLAEVEPQNSKQLPMLGDLLSSFDALSSILVGDKQNSLYALDEQEGKMVEQDGVLLYSPRISQFLGNVVQVFAPSSGYEKKHWLFHVAVGHARMQRAVKARLDKNETHSLT